MDLNTTLAMVWFVASIGAGIFSLSAIVNYFRRDSRTEDWKKAVFFFILSGIFLYFFSITS